MRPKGVESFRTDAGDFTQIVDRLKRAILFSVLDDPLGDCLSDAGQLDEFGDLRVIDVDDKVGFARGPRFGTMRSWAVVFDELPLETAVAEPPDDDEDQDRNDAQRDDRLIGPPHEEIVAEPLPDAGSRIHA